MSPSGPEIKIVPATQAHVRSIARRMRQADRDECDAASGKSPYAALSRARRMSRHAWTGLINGRPEVMFGIGHPTVLEVPAYPWLLATDAVVEHRRVFLPMSRKLLKELTARYPLLQNFVDARNTVSIRWLRWLGFTIGEPIAYRGHRFRQFWRRRDV